MCIWSSVWEFFQGDKVATAAAMAVFCLTILSAVVGFCTRSTGLYAALCLLIVSVFCVIFYGRKLEEETLVWALAIEGGLVGVGYATVYILLEIQQKILLRRKQRAEIKRQLQFTLPDRENGYLRDRLHTAFRTEKEDKDTEKRSAGVRVHYARKMLAKIKEAQLTPVERIDVEEMARILALYEIKEKWSTSDIKAMSEVFSRLLKLAAKYEVAV